MKYQKNIQIDSKSGKPILVDAYWKTSEEEQPIVVFAHGFKGFKDWGTWEMIGKKIVEAGFVFIKFNFSHNGTTPKSPLDFDDLEAFGENNYEIELDDLDTILNWIGKQEIIPNANLDINKINLIGHSRGGGVAIIRAHEDTRINSLITWAAVGTLDWMFKPKMIEEWKKNGVHIIVNGRTKQNMPLYYQLYENFEKNSTRFDIKKALKELDKPHLIIQGTNDPAISVESAKLHQQWNENAEIVLIHAANHVFGGSHPFVKKELPEHTEQLINATIDFLKRS